MVLSLVPGFVPAIPLAWPAMPDGIELCSVPECLGSVPVVSVRIQAVSLRLPARPGGLGCDSVPAVPGSMPAVFVYVCAGSSSETAGNSCWY